jgi:hypothetical protein
LLNVTEELHLSVADLEEAVSEIMIFNGVLPICMHCKQIRDDQGYWNKLEKFIGEHTEAQLSHGICENCLGEFYPEIKG